MLNTELDAVVLSMEILVGGRAQLNAYLADAMQNYAFAVPPKLPDGMCDYVRYEEEIRTLQQKMAQSMEIQRVAEVAVDSFKNNMNMSDRMHRSDLSTMQNAVSSKRIDAMEHRRHLHFFLQSNTPINGPTFQLKMQHLIDEKLRILSMIRLSEIDALQAEKMQLAKAEAMEEAAAFAGGV